MTEKALVLRLAGPMQSWGVRGGFADYRDTITHPTRSGVLGLLGCALGRPRGSGPGDLSDLDLAVRVDRPGTLMEDYHTVGGQSGREVVPSADGSRRRGAMLTRRAYLADAAFTVVLTGPSALLHSLEEALDHPRYVPFLGRRACPPASPYNLGIHAGSVDDILSSAPLDRARPNGRDTVSVEVVRAAHPDDPAATHTLNDNPCGQRRFTQRALARSTVTLPAELCTGIEAAVRYAALHRYRHGTPAQ